MDVKFLVIVSLIQKHEIIVSEQPCVQNIQQMTLHIICCDHFVKTQRAVQHITCIVWDRREGRRRRGGVLICLLAQTPNDNYIPPNVLQRRNIPRITLLRRGSPESVFAFEPHLNATEIIQNMRTKLDFARLLLIQH